MTSIIDYRMLKHLPSVAQNTLLHIVNKLWLSESFPHTWQQAVVLPIPKADKDKSYPCNYRPIALTSCLCKIAIADLSGTWRKTSSLPTSRAVFASAGVQPINLYDQKPHCEAFTLLLSK